MGGGSTTLKTIDEACGPRVAVCVCVGGGGVHRGATPNDVEALSCRVPSGEDLL